MYTQIVYLKSNPHKNTHVFLSGLWLQYKVFNMLMDYLGICSALLIPSCHTRLSHMLILSLVFTAQGCNLSFTSTQWHTFIIGLSSGCCLFEFVSLSSLVWHATATCTPPPPQLHGISSPITSSAIILIRSHQPPPSPISRLLWDEVPCNVQVPKYFMIITSINIINIILFSLACLSWLECI